MKISKFFPFLLIFSALSAAIEIELSLPSFPDIARAFSVSPEVIEGTISLNFLGFCVSALFYGPLSDLFGRRPVLLWGTVLYLIGSLGCSLASSIDMILISRFIQGLGAAASFVVVFIMLSDAYKENAGHWIGLLSAVLTATMATAPILGGYLNYYFGWSACYTFISVMTLIQLVLLILFLPETRKGQLIALKDVIKDYAKLVSSFRFMQSSFVPTLLAGGYMSFVSVIPFLYRDKLEMSLTEFSYHQAAIITSFSLMSYYANRVAKHFGEVKSAVTGAVVSAIATSALFIVSIFHNIPSVWLITPLMCVFAVACAVPFNIVFTASLSLFPDKNGPASSLLMSMRTLLCSIAIQLAGYFYDGNLFATAGVVATCCLISLVLTVSFYFGKAPAPSQELDRA